MDNLPVTYQIRYKLSEEILWSKDITETKPLNSTGSPRKSLYSEAGEVKIV